MILCKTCGLPAKYEYVVNPSVKHPYCSAHLPRAYRTSPLLKEIGVADFVETPAPKSSKKKPVVEIVEEVQPQEETEETL